MYKCIYDVHMYICIYVYVDRYGYDHIQRYIPYLQGASSLSQGLFRWSLAECWTVFGVIHAKWIMNGELIVVNSGKPEENHREMVINGD